MTLRTTTFLLLNLVASVAVLCAAVTSWNAPQADATHSTTPPIAVAQVAVADVLSPSPQGPPPHIEVPLTGHDFGVVDVGQSGVQTFLVRNVGEGPLILKCGETSCKCTRCEVGSDPIPPGESRDVTIGWKATEPAEHFRHGAWLETNDPETPRISLVVSGHVRTHLAASPATLVFTDVPKEEPRTATMLVYSQAWEAFEIGPVESSLEQLSWQARPASTESLSKLKARSGYELQATLAPGLKPGKFSGQLKLNVVPAADEQATEGEVVASSNTTRQLTIDVQGNVRSNVSVFGKDLEGNARLPIGTLLHGEGAHRTLSIIVRGQERELAVRELAVKPDFLQARLERDPASSELSTRYRLHIEVPETAPAGTYRGERAGEVVLRTNHPELAELRLYLDFVIAPPATR